MRRVDPVAHILNPGHPLARLSTGRVMDSHLLSHLPQVPAVGAAAGEVTSAQIKVLSKTPSILDQRKSQR